MQRHCEVVSAKGFMEGAEFSKELVQRDWIWGRELKLEGLRNLERVEAESERYLASSVMVLPPWGIPRGGFFLKT